MTKAVFHNAVNLKAFDYSSLLNGSFSGETSSNFTLTSGNETINVSGSGFVYADGTPVGGTITDIGGDLNGKFDFSLTGMNLSVAQLETDINNSDTAALRTDLFGGNDQITGSQSADVLWGFDGNDRLDGRGGNDTLVGGSGHDKLTGGGGADTFQFRAITDSKVNHADLITDLQSGDTIDLSHIDADTTQAGNQAFTLVGSFTDHAGQATLSYDAGTDRTTLSLDVNGDGHADSAIEISGDHTDFTSFVL